MNSYPAGVSGAEIDGRESLLDHKSHDEVFEDIFAWADAKTIFKFYLDNAVDPYESYSVGENVWDLLDFSTKHKIAEKLIKDHFIVKFVEENIEKYEEEQKELTE